MQQSKFIPAWWLKHAHLQTIYPAIFRANAKNTRIKRERIITPDNDFLDIDCCGEDKDQPLVILLHGLTGSSQSKYIKGMQVVLEKQGFRSISMNFRGCSGVSNNLARCYHSGETEDIHFLYQTLRMREPDTAIAVVGFSLGGNVLLKWLGEQGDAVSLFSACAVSVPLVLSACATKLDSGFSRLYRNSLIRELKQYIKMKHKHLKSTGKLSEAKRLAEIGPLSAIRSFWQYDEQVIARLHGFDSAADYYEKSSSRYFLNQIAVPTLIIQSYDDPFMTKEVIPAQAEMSSKVELEMTQAGGHVGFINGGNPLKPEYWLEKRIPAFLKFQLNNSSDL